MGMCVNNLIAAKQRLRFILPRNKIWISETSSLTSNFFANLPSTLNCVCVCVGSQETQASGEMKGDHLTSTRSSRSRGSKRPLNFAITIVWFIVAFLHTPYISLTHITAEVLRYGLFYLSPLSSQIFQKYKCFNWMFTRNLSVKPNMLPLLLIVS